MLHVALCDLHQSHPSDVHESLTFKSCTCELLEPFRYLPLLLYCLRCSWTSRCRSQSWSPWLHPSSVKTEVIWVPVIPYSLLTLCCGGKLWNEGTFDLGCPPAPDTKMLLTATGVVKHVAACTPVLPLPSLHLILQAGEGDEMLLLDWAVSPCSCVKHGRTCCAWACLLHAGDAATPPNAAAV